MSNITTDFITATKKIHADVRAVLSTLHLIREDVKVIREDAIQSTDKRSSDHQTNDSNEKEAQGIVNRGHVANTNNSREKETKSDSKIGRAFQNFKNNLWRDVQKPKTYVEFAALIFLVLYTCETHKTNVLTETSLNLVKDQQRPYVLSTFGLVRSKSLEPNKAADFNVMLYNVGDSMATNIRPSKPRIRVGGKEANEEARKCSISYPPEPIKEVLPPHQIPQNGQGFTLITISTPVLDQAEYNSLTAYDAATNTFTGDQIVIWGGVEYTGMSGGEYSTEYCFLYHPTGMPVGECGYCKAMR